MKTAEQRAREEVLRVGAEQGLSVAQVDALRDAAETTIGSCPCPGCAWIRLMARVDSSVLSESEIERCIAGGKATIAGSPRRAAN